MRRLLLSIVFLIFAGSCCGFYLRWTPPSTPVTPAPVELDIRPESTPTDPAPTKAARPVPTLTDIESEMRFITDTLAYGDCLMPAMENIQLEINRQAEGVGSLSGIVYAAEDLRDCHQFLPRNPPLAWKPAHQHMVRADTCLIQLADSLERFVMTENSTDGDHALQGLECVSREYGAATVAIPK